MKIFINLIALFTMVMCMDQVKAENLHNREGFVYENAKILSVDASRVRLSHATGIGWVAFEDLTEESLQWLHEQASYKDFQNKLAEDKVRAEKEGEMVARRAANARKDQAETESRAQEKKEQETKAAAEAERVKREAVRVEYGRLSKLQPLWVHDFHALEKIIGEDWRAIDSLMGSFVAEFGKPDRERVYTVATTEHAFVGRDIKEVAGPDISVTELTYTNRLKNPLTEGKEDLIIRFSNGFYHSAVASPSGHKSR